MNITKACIIDATEILELQKLAFISEAKIYNDFSIPPLLQTLNEIKEDFKSYIFLKYVEDGKIIGSVRGHIENDVCIVERLIVSDNFQGRGIGTNLMNKIEKAFCDCARYELFTGKKSLRTISLYEKLGYTIFKEKEINDNTTLVFLQKSNI